MRPRLLDLYCKAGGAAWGYYLAGFDVQGVDKDPQPNYPWNIIQRDVMTLTPEWIAANFDAVHASPICQGLTELRPSNKHRKEHENQIPPTRALLKATGLPYMIENVRNAREHLIDPIRLNGFMFGLGSGGYHLQRDRLFECSFPVIEPPFTPHQPVIGMYGGHVRCRSAKHGGRRTRDFDGLDKPKMAAESMGINWMTMEELSEAVPPAYTRFLGGALQMHLATRRAA